MYGPLFNYLAVNPARRSPSLQSTAAHPHIPASVSLSSESFSIQLLSMYFQHFSLWWTLELVRHTRLRHFHKGLISFWNTCRFALHTPINHKSVFNSFLFLSAFYFPVLYISEMLCELFNITAESYLLPSWCLKMIVMSGYCRFSFPGQVDVLWTLSVILHSHNCT